MFGNKIAIMRGIKWELESASCQKFEISNLQYITWTNYELNSNNINCSVQSFPYYEKLFYVWKVMKSCLIELSRRTQSFC